MRKPSFQARRSLLALGAVALSLGVSACGNKTNHPHQEVDVDGSASSGFYVDAGNPAVTYQVQISRELNPYATEDKTYLLGVPSADLGLSPSQEWFGVFIWAKNQSHTSTMTSDKFTITDTQGDTYYPVPINTSMNDLAWTSQLLRPQQTEPMADSPAFYSATQGGEILFKINNDLSPDSVYSNRPLLLNIYAKGQSKPSQISLDL